MKAVHGDPVWTIQRNQGSVSDKNGALEYF